MNRKDLGPVLTAGQLSEVRALLRQLQHSGSLLELAKPSVASLLRAIDVENDGTTVPVEAPRIDDTGDIAIPDEVVDLRVLLDCRRERDEAIAEISRTGAKLGKCQADVDRLIDLLDQCAAELTSIYDTEYASRDIYPDMQRRYDRDMSLVREIRAAIDAAMRKVE